MEIITLVIRAAHIKGSFIFPTSKVGNSVFIIKIRYTSFIVIKENFLTP